MARPFGPRRTTAGRLAAGVAASLAATLLPIAASAAAKHDAAVVVSATDRRHAIAGGGRDTAFSLALPTGAACPGDSEEGQYRVQSFIVPAVVDPGDLQYRGLRPVAEGGWALYRTDTTTYMNAATNKASTPGGEGAIINIPALSFAVFEPGMLPGGRYRMGLACSVFADTKRYWAVEVDVIGAADGIAPGITWRVVNPPAAVGSTGRRTPVTIGLIGLASAGVAVLYARRRAPRDVASVGDA